MPAYKDKEKGTWYASFYYEDWTGKKVKKMKRGFPTKREALEWERTFLQQQTADLEMTFENFVAVYVADMKGRIKENTWGTKEHILYKKLVPYFGKRKMCDIHSKEVIAWQNEMLGYKDKNGKPYSPVYLKTLHNQLSAVFNHAVRHYNLKVNPAAQVGNMGKPKSREMLFWTKAEYLKFAEAMMDKPLSYYAFEMLYWCGVREGELLALTPADFDFEKQTVTISKSYQRIKGRDVITDPKTPKSNRVIQMMLPTIFSRGWPCFSYIASMKKGSMTSIIHMAASLFPAGPRSRKKSGTPISAPPVKQTSCLLVRLKATFVLTLVKSLGTGT